MKSSIIALMAGAALFVSCNNEQNPFEISKQHIGSLTDSTQVKDLKLAFAKDSISRFKGDPNFLGNVNDIEIFDKTGKKLLVLTPHQLADSTSTIKSIKVEDARFMTAKGLSNASTFKDIKDNYKISSIQNSLRNIIVSINDINVYVTIDKKELPAELRYNINAKIDAIQIPDAAKIKGFFIQWF